MNTAAEARTPPTLNPGGSNKDKDKDTNLYPQSPRIYTYSNPNKRRDG